MGRMQGESDLREIRDSVEGPVLPELTFPIKPGQLSNLFMYLKDFGGALEDFLVPFQTCGRSDLASILIGSSWSPFSTRRFCHKL